MGDLNNDFDDDSTRTRAATILKQRELWEEAGMAVYDDSIAPLTDARASQPKCYLSYTLDTRIG